MFEKKNVIISLWEQRGRIVPVKTDVQLIISRQQRLGYVRNPRSLMEGTETLCRDDIGDLPGSPEHLWLRENANEIG